MNKLTKTIIAAIIAILVIAGIWMVSTKDHTKKDTATSNGKPAAQKTVKIGAILGLTGEAASYGQGAQKGIELAVEKIKREKNLDVQMVYEDSQMDPKKAVDSFQKLTSLKDVKYFTTMSSGEMLAICPLAESKKDVLVGTGSSSAITNCGDYTFRDMPSDSFQGKEMAKKIYDRGVRKVAIMYINNEYGTGIKDEFTKNFQGEIVASEAHDPKGTDFRTQLTKVKSFNPDAIVLISQLSEGSALLKQKGELEISIPIYTSEGLKDENLIKNVPAEALKNIYSFFPIQYSGKESKEYKDNYTQKFDEDYAAFSDYMYDTILMLADAMDKCVNPNDAECVKNKLYEINITGATGKIVLDKNGDLEAKTYDLYTIQNNQFVAAN